VIEHGSLRRMVLWVPLMCTAVLGGCVWGKEDKKKLDLGVAPKPAPGADSAAVRDTIGALSYFDGMGPLRVRGYGLVVGLGKNGSNDCPRPIRDRLVESLYKQQRGAADVVGVATITPEQLIDDIDTAVVVVGADVPPAATEGTRFDVSVMALPGTKTKSLRGGRLYTTELEVYRESAAGTTVSGKLMARAAGPVFINPFAEGDAATKGNPLEGIVVGGGKAVEDRQLRLVLGQPSYVWARKIQDRINQHFPQANKVADAISPSYVEIHVPREYQQDIGHFLGLVRSLYLSNDPQFAAVRARLLGQEIQQPSAPHAEIALCFEGLGPAALPALQELYTHEKDYVSFHAGVAGIRLGDHLAGDVICRHAEAVDGAFRFQAIHALATARGMAGPAAVLRRLLEAGDPRVQIAAYEALVARADPTILSKTVASDNFRLDLIPTKRPNFVYVKRSQARRVALFGEDLECRPPVHYRSPDGSITLTAQPSDDGLTLLRVVVPSGSMSPPVVAPFDLPDVIELMGRDADVDLDGKVVGLGLDYGAVARAVYHLCKDHAVNAQFILEQPNAAEMFGPAPVAGRPESEL